MILGFYSRGAEIFQTISDYYWYGKLVADNDDILADPSLAIETGKNLFRQVCSNEWFDSINTKSTQYYDLLMGF